MSDTFGPPTTRVSPFKTPATPSSANDDSGSAGDDTRVGDDSETPERIETPIEEDNHIVEPEEITDIKIGDDGKPKFRTWSNETGEYQIEALFKSYANGVVKLWSSERGVIEVPLDKLSEEDREYVRAKNARKKKKPNT